MFHLSWLWKILRRDMRWFVQWRSFGGRRCGENEVVYCFGFRWGRHDGGRSENSASRCVSALAACELLYCRLAAAVA
jgi:hypothetical protein